MKTIKDLEIFLNKVNYPNTSTDYVQSVGIYELRKEAIGGI